MKIHLIKLLMSARTLKEGEEKIVQKLS